MAKAFQDFENSGTYLPYQNPFSKTTGLFLKTGSYRNVKTTSGFFVPKLWEFLKFLVGDSCEKKGWWEYIINFVEKCVGRFHLEKPSLTIQEFLEDFKRLIKWLKLSSQMLLFDTFCEHWTSCNPPKKTDASTPHMCQLSNWCISADRSHTPPLPLLLDCCHSHVLPHHWHSTRGRKGPGRTRQVFAVYWDHHLRWWR